MIDPKCPKCANEQTQKLSAIHAVGTTHIDTTSYGVGAAVGDGTTAGGGTVRTQGTTRTALASRLAPPSKKPVVSGIVLVLFVAFVIGLFSGWLALAWLALGVWLIASAIRYNRNAYPGLIASWNKQFYCGRCDTVFVPSAPADS
jgi:hypothetical protein